FLALVNEAYSTHAERHPGNPLRSLFRGGLSGFFAGNPAAILAVLLLAGAVAIVIYATRHDPTQCKAEVLRQKLEIQQRYARPPSTQRAAPPAAAPGSQAPAPPRQSPFGGVFNPQNLQTAPAPTPAPAPAPPRQEPFGGVFNPQNLQKTPSPSTS